MTTRRQFFGLAAGAVAATMLPSAPVAREVVEAAKVWPNGARFFKDLAGTIPCQPGDTAALMVNTWGSEQTFLSQPAEACRPVYGENSSGMGFARFDVAQSLGAVRCGPDVPLYSFHISSDTTEASALAVAAVMMQALGIKQG